MQQIADWLQRLGLGQYAKAFAENDISFAVLPDLTDQDLKKLGVASLGRDNRTKGKLHPRRCNRRDYRSDWN
jgi:hypothetical protein